MTDLNVPALLERYAEYQAAVAAEQALPDTELYDEHASVVRRERFQALNMEFRKQVWAAMDAGRPPDPYYRR
jgi:hypothetical protein